MAPFRGSIPSLPVPLSTLHVRPRGRPHMTRGQDGSLFLSCTTLSFATLCRFIPTLSRPGGPLHGDRRGPRRNCGGVIQTALLHEVRRAAGPLKQTGRSAPLRRTSGLGVWRRRQTRRSAPPRHTSGFRVWSSGENKKADDPQTAWAPKSAPLAGESPAPPEHTSGVRVWTS